MAGYIGNRAAFLSSTSGADIDGNVTIDGDLTVSGNTVTIDSAQAQEIRLGDNDKMTFGDATGGDLQIYSDGTNGYIEETGSGNLRIITNGPSVAINKGTIGGENMAVFNADGAVQLFYDNSQKLSTTSYGIDVNGTVNITGRFLSDTVGAGGGVTSGYQFGGDGNTGMYQDAYDQIQFSTAGTERMRINSNGKVGIGTTTPGDELTVVGQALFSYTDVSASSSAQYAQVEIQKDDVDANWSYLAFHEIGSIAWQQGILDNKFVIASTGGASKTSTDAERLVIDTSGNVGIGTSSPSFSVGQGLHIDSGGYTAINLQKGTSGGGGHIIDFTDASNTVQYRIGTNFASGGENLLFAYGSAPTIGMTLNSSGNVGIGTTSPSEKLDIAGNIKLRNGSVLYVENPGGGRLGYLQTNNSGTLLSSYNGFGEPLLLSAPNGYMQMSTGGTPRIRVNNAGTTHFYSGISGQSIKVVFLTNSFQNILGVDVSLGNSGMGYCICSTSENNFRQGWILTLSSSSFHVHYLGGDEGHTHSKDVAFQISGNYLQARRVNYTTGRPLEIFQVHGAFTADYD